jgi:molecular chaperone GrpE
MNCVFLANLILESKHLTRKPIFSTLNNMSKVKNLKKLNSLKNGVKQTNVKVVKNPATEADLEEQLSPQVSNPNSKSKPVGDAKQTENIEVSELELLKIQLKSKEDESKDWQNKAFRYVADLENYKKHQELELAQTKKNTKKITVKPLLEFLNNQYLSLNFIKDITDEKAQKAFAAFNSSFEKIIVEYKLHGVELILPVVGDKFDPVTMQALAPTEDEEAIIKHIVSLGLRVDNQLIQPVMVVL